MSHNCKAIAFTCIDWRLHPQLEELLKEHCGVFDLCATAGAVKGLHNSSSQDFFLNQIEISVKLHSPETIILTVHRDCGAYGGSGAFANKDEEFAHHSKVLEETADFLKAKFPEFKIEKFFIELEERDGKWQCLLLPV